MKKIAIYFLVLCLFLWGSSAFAYFDAPRLAVRVFDNKTDRGGLNPPASAITDMMTTELYNSGLFALMEREKLDYVIDELNLAQSGLMDPSTAPQIGKIKGAEYSMTGAITVYCYNTSGGAIVVRGLGVAAASNTAYVTLDIRIIDNSTGEVVYAAAETGSAKRGAAGLLLGFAGGGTVQHGGIMASATRDAVIKHVNTMKRTFN